MGACLFLGEKTPNCGREVWGMRRRLIMWLPIAAAVAAALANAMDWGP
jgi:hypothetical protein